MGKPHTYKFLDEAERDDLMVLTYESQEREKFQYEANLERYNLILSKIDPEVLAVETQRAKDIERLREEIKAKAPKAPLPPYTPVQWMILNRRDTILRIDQTDEYLEATDKQLPTGQRLKDATKRFKERKTKERQV